MGQSQSAVVEDIPSTTPSPTGTDVDGDVDGDVDINDRSTGDLLDDIEEFAHQNASLEGIAASKELSDFKTQYANDSVQSNDISYFLLTLCNHCDEKTNSINLRGLACKSKTRSKKGIQKLASQILNEKVKGSFECVLSSSQALAKLSKELCDSKKKHSVVKEKDGSGMKYCNKRFKNWGRSIRTKKKIPTFIPKSKVGLCNLVQWAKSKSLSVRVAGYRHSWSDITVNDGQILVSLLPAPQVETPPANEEPIDEENEEGNDEKLLANEEPIDEKNDLQGISLLDDYIEEDGEQKRLCRIGAATTNEQFRRWVIDNSLLEDKEKGDTWKPWWTLPLNTVLVEITFGGSNASICHGAGKHTTTLSDLVTAIEFVNANGELQVVDDPLQLKSASGCFGMLGLVTSITMKLDALTFANMTPKKKLLPLTIPPPKGFEIPSDIDMTGISEEMLDDAFEEFKHQCENDYYVEYFWFPGQEKTWTNCWNNDGNSTEAVEYPCDFTVKYQETTSFLSGIVNNIIFRFLSPEFQMNVLSTFAMLDLPERQDDNPIVTPLIEGIHFRRGVHNMRVNDMEWEIPIPGLKLDPSKPDYSVCQKAWWVVIKNFYNRFNQGDIPMRLPLEMRITGGSSVHLAPQYGNHDHGTCSIEILTPENVDANEWNGFTQETIDSWLSLKDDDGDLIHPFKNNDGNLLYCRPHWAKEWMGLKVEDEPINDYLKNKAFKDQIPLFIEGLKAVAEAGGYTLEAANDIFSTSFSKDFFSKSDKDVDDNDDKSSDGVTNVVIDAENKTEPTIIDAPAENYRSLDIKPVDDIKQEFIKENDENLTRLSLPDGSLYTGCTKDGKMHGFGKLVWLTGTIYEGEWINNKIHGSGTFKKADGSVYVGSWEDGMKSGTGILTWANGDTYEGEYMRDKKHGNGVYKYADGSVYDGVWDMNLKHGKGVLTYKNGDVYEGEFKDDKRTGQGTYSYASGNVYKGGWNVGKKDGPGVKTFKSGKVQIGAWDNDKFVEEF